MTRPVRPHPSPAASRQRRTNLAVVLRALAAAAGLVALLTGVPLVLALTVASPIPGLQDLIAGDASDRAVLAVLALIVWLAWAQFTLAVLVEVASALSRTPIRRRIPGVLPSQQYLARALVTAVLVLIPALSPLAGATGAGAQAVTYSGTGPTPATSAPIVAGPQNADVAHPRGSVAEQSSTADHAATEAARQSPQVEPEHGDPREHRAGQQVHTITAGGPGTYWELAERYFGDGQAWKQIWAANQGHRQDDGTVMDDPGLLRVGWKVVIPAHHQTHQSLNDPDVEQDMVTVHRGDTLHAIAREHDTTWPRLWEENRGRPEPGGAHLRDPDHIEPGWRIDVPASSSPAAAVEDTHRSAPEPSAQPPHEPSTSSRQSHAEPPAAQTGAPADETDRHAAAPTTGTPQHADPQDVPVPAATTSRAALSDAASPDPARTSMGVDGRHVTGRVDPAPASAVEHAAGETGSRLTMLSLGTGAGLLAAGALITLLAARRRQFRHRRPGRAIAATPTDLLQVEKALLAQGSESLGDVTWLDEALRSMAAQVTLEGGRLPSVVAVRMGVDELELILADPTDPQQISPPAPWVRDDVSGRWQLSRSQYVPDDSAQRRYRYPPYPTLASVGYSDSGDYWLLDLEQVATLTLTGDHDRCVDLARFVAADLAHNIWSEQLRVTLAGLGHEVRDINPDRVVHVTDTAQAIAQLREQLSTNQEVLSEAGLTDVLQGRQGDIAADQWMPQILLIDVADAYDPALSELEDLLTRLRWHRATRHARSAVAVVLTGEPVAYRAPAAEEGGWAAGWHVQVDATGQLHIPELALTLNAQQLPAHEATQLARLLGATGNLTDRGMPAADGPAAWELLSDAAGAPLPHLTTPRLQQPAPIARTAARVTSRRNAPVTASGRVHPRIRLAPAHISPDPTAFDQGPVPGADDDGGDPTVAAAVDVAGPADAGAARAEGAQSDGAQAEGTQARGAEAGVASPAPGPFADDTSSDQSIDESPATEDATVDVAEPAPAAGPMTVPGPSSDLTEGGQASSVVPQPNAEVLQVTATTEHDVELLAPSVPAAARRRVEDADADLDADLAAWASPSEPRPRLSLLGPLQVRTIGHLPVDRPRVSWHTEVVAYLATHPRGVNGEQLGTDLWPRDSGITSKSKVRQAVYLVRLWLGQDPATKKHYVPSATGAGPKVYRIENLLSDADLFRRLRLRGVARGEDGIGDLEAALGLVTGPPFDARRPGGYTWLVDLPLDHEYTGMIVDVAHLVATHHLAAGRPDRAAAAAQVSLLAGSRDDVALLDLVAACDAQDNQGEATAWIHRILANHDAEVEEDLPPRTAEILHRRRWIDRAS